MKFLTVTLADNDVTLDYNDDDPPVIVSHLTPAELVQRIERAQSEGYVIGFATD